MPSSDRRTDQDNHNVNLWPHPLQRVCQTVAHTSTAIANCKTIVTTELSVQSTFWPDVFVVSILDGPSLGFSLSFLIL
ncbi:hypothetical protein RRG08_029604 [Elysia crispata]|uniref:Uncharacterized protein n=1 Tax=Elysia crispata TaxID=231223 RepID=A0AAE0XQF8_9GAST|nr:hypothetical protein RRG08_029604 [Elysia crispata]